MRDSKSIYTSICDKCGKALTSESGYPPLRSIYLNDMRGSYSSADCRRHFMDLCSVCFDNLLEYLSAEDKWKALVDEAARYRSDQ
jgi:hypothetical protein